jgi:SPX domain protein involved in polyphosphate accumulation
MKYSQFLEVARRAEGYVELQKFFVDFSGLKELILKIELLKKDQKNDQELENDLRKRFTEGLALDIQKIDKVAGLLIAKIEEDLQPSNLERQISPAEAPAEVLGNPTSPTNVDVRTKVASGDLGLDVTYKKALLVKQYCELNAEGVRKIAKKYDKRASGAGEQDRRVSELKGLSFGDGGIDILVQKIEQQLIAQGKLDTESETASFCEKEGIYVTGAEDKDVKTVQKFLQVLSMVLLNGPDDFGITVKLLEPIPPLRWDQARRLQGTKRHSKRPKWTSGR